MTKKHQDRPKRKSQTPPVSEQQQEGAGENGMQAYGHALSLMFYEGQIAWQINVLFVGLNIGIGTIIQDKLCLLNKFDLVLILMSIAGLVINYFWLGTFRRNNRYYHFRMAQARELEPLSLKLISDRGYRFSHGEKIEIPIGSPQQVQGDLSHQLSRYEKRASNRKAIGVSIWLFLITFGLLFIGQLVYGIIYLHHLFQKCL